jgi:hypothetical protein
MLGRHGVGLVGALAIALGARLAGPLPSLLSRCSIGLAMGRAMALPTQGKARVRCFGASPGGK